MHNLPNPQKDAHIGISGRYPQPKCGISCGLSMFLQLWRDIIFSAETSWLNPTHPAGSPVRHTQAWVQSSPGRASLLAPSRTQTFEEKSIFFRPKN